MWEDNHLLCSVAGNFVHASFRSSGPVQVALQRLSFIWLLFHMYTPYNFGYDNWPLLSSFKVEIFLNAASTIKVFRDNKHKYNYCTGSKHQWLSLF